MTEPKTMEETFVQSGEASQTKFCTPSEPSISQVSHLSHPNKQPIISSVNSSSKSSLPEEPEEKVESKEESHILYPVTIHTEGQQSLQLPPFKENDSSTEHCDVKNHDLWSYPHSPDIPPNNIPINQNRQKATVIYLRADHTQSVQSVNTQFFPLDSMGWQSSEVLTSPQIVQENTIPPVVKSQDVCTNETYVDNEQKSPTPTGQPEKTGSRGSRIPRPPNAFMIFGREHRKLLAMQHKNETNKMISVRLGNMWRSLPKDIKDRYYVKAKLTEFEHQRKYPDYEYNPIEARKRKNDMRLARIGNKKANALSSNKGCSGVESEASQNGRSEAKIPGINKAESLKNRQEFFIPPQRPQPQRAFVRYSIPPNGSCTPTRIAPFGLRYHPPYPPFSPFSNRFYHTAGPLRKEDPSTPKMKQEIKDSESNAESNNSSEQGKSPENEQVSTSIDANSEQSQSEQRSSVHPPSISMPLLNQCSCHSNMMNGGHYTFPQERPLHYMSSGINPGSGLLKSSHDLPYPPSQHLIDRMHYVQANGGSLAQDQVVNPIKMEKSELTISSKDGRFQASSNSHKMELSLVRERFAIDDNSKNPFSHFAAYPTFGGSMRPSLGQDPPFVSPVSDTCGPLPYLYRTRPYYYHPYGNSANPRDHVMAGWNPSAGYWVDNCLHSQPRTSETASRPEIMNALSDALDTLNYEASHL